MERRYPERAKSWRKTNESYLGHFKDINALIEAQYMKTLGLAVAKSDFDARAAKVLLRPVTNGTNDVNNICNIAMSSQGVVKLIQNYPIDRSEKSIDALYKAIENGSIDRLADTFKKMPVSVRSDFATSFLGSFGK